MGSSGEPIDERARRHEPLPTDRLRDLLQDAKVAGDFGEEPLPFCVLDELDRLDRRMKRLRSDYLRYRHLVCRPWLRSDEKFLEVLCDNGRTPAEISETMGRPCGVVRRKIHDMGLEDSSSGAAWTDYEVKALIRYKIRGLTDAQIAYSLARTEGAVKSKVKSLVKSGEMIDYGKQNH